jgi:hypothetical protein
MGGGGQTHSEFHLFVSFHPHGDGNTLSLEDTLFLLLVTSNDMPAVLLALPYHIYMHCRDVKIHNSHRRELPCTTPVCDVETSL